uniref:IlGF domain-containing protein n=1 Tax=Parastrongyloides trichosuri TaxID=131310 RepID=A0A0N4Z4W8_PARTI
MMTRRGTTLQSTTIFSVLIILIYTIYMVEPRARNNGQIKMCPPGGESFAIAWQLSCNLMRKRNQGDNEKSGKYVKRSNEYKKEYSTSKRYVERALSMNELMRYCCLYGCTPKDLTSYCF